MEIFIAYLTELNAKVLFVHKHITFINKARGKINLWNYFLSIILDVW